MNRRSSKALANLTALTFVLSCTFETQSTIPATPAHFSKTFKPGDQLSGEWRVNCEVRVYENGKLLKTLRDEKESLVVIESDPDGSYHLYKFPAGFGEALPRLRRINQSQYAGEDTVRGISTVIKQTVELSGGRITIKQTVVDAGSKQVQTETTCSGSRSRSSIKVDAAGSVQVCRPDPSSDDLPDKTVIAVYKYVRPFSDDLAAVAIQSRKSQALKWGFIDRTGRVVIPMRYDVVTSFCDGLAAAGILHGTGRSVKWGVIEKLGPQVTPYVKYDSVKILGEGFAAVGYVVPGRPGLRWNLINRENTTIFHGLDDIVCFADGRAQASYSEGAVIRSGYFNKVGDFISDKK
jgi:hypothetical protein